MDLVLWEMKWYSVDTEWLIGECVFCPFETKRLETPSTTADLLAASQHECGGHDDALRHVVYVRSAGARGVPFVA
jgi:hypothetical protein